MECVLGVYYFSKIAFGDFPDNPVVKTLNFCRGIGSMPVEEIRSWMSHSVAKKKKKKGKKYLWVNIFFFVTPCGAPPSSQSWM